MVYIFLSLLLLFIYSFIYLFTYFFLVFCWVMLLLSSYNITILKDIYESRKISVYYTYIYRIVSTSRSALDLFFFSFLLVIPLSFPSRYLSNLRLNLSFIFFVFFVFFAFFVSSSLWKTVRNEIRRCPFEFCFETHDTYSVTQREINRG